MLVSVLLRELICEIPNSFITASRTSQNPFSCVVALRCTAGDIRICSMAQRGLSVCELKKNQFLWDLKIVCAPPPPPYVWPSDIWLLHIDVEDLLWWWSWFCFITPDGKCGFRKQNTLHAFSILSTTSQWVCLHVQQIVGGYQKSCSSL